MNILIYNDVITICCIQISMPSSNIATIRSHSSYGNTKSLRYHVKINHLSIISILLECAPDYYNDDHKPQYSTAQSNHLLVRPTNMHPEIDTVCNH
jgi:hypothetical protein